MEWQVILDTVHFPIENAPEVFFIRKKDLFVYTEGRLYPKWGDLAIYSVYQLSFHSFCLL